MPAKIDKKCYALVSTEGTLWCTQGLATERYTWPVKLTSQPRILFFWWQY